MSEQRSEEKERNGNGDYGHFNRKTITFPRQF